MKYFRFFLWLSLLVLFVQVEMEELTYVLVSSNLFPCLPCSLQLPKLMTKPTINVVKRTKTSPIKKILASIENIDDNDDDDNGESFDKIHHNTYI